MRNTRRATNSRSVTSCVGPSTYSLILPSTSTGRILNVSGVESERPYHCTGIHFPKVMTCTLALAAARVDITKAEARTPLLVTSRIFLIPQRLGLSPVGSNIVHHNLSVRCQIGNGNFRRTVLL